MTHHVLGLDHRRVGDGAGADDEEGRLDVLGGEEGEEAGSVGRRSVVCGVEGRMSDAPETSGTSGLTERYSPGVLCRAVGDISRATAASASPPACTPSQKSARSRFPPSSPPLLPSQQLQTKAQLTVAIRRSVRHGRRVEGRVLAPVETVDRNPGRAGQVDLGDPLEDFGRVDGRLAVKGRVGGRVNGVDCFEAGEEVSESLGLYG